MSWLLRVMMTDGQRADPRRAPAPAATPARPLPPSGGYLTDGVNLYRYLGTVASRAGELIGIENCWSLDIMLVPIQDLHVGRLRPIGAAGSE